MARPFNILTDRIIALAKWPAAAGSLLILWPCALTLGDAVVLFWRNPYSGLALLAGMTLLLAWHRRWGTLGFWATFEHEMTHILFALLTLHPVRALQATEGQGGLMSHGGNGNWLVSIAPYFFPTFPLLVGAIVLAFPPSLRLLGVGCIGFALAWHLAATLAETHRGQTDLRRVGLSFAALFLPGPSLFSIGFVLALALRGSHGPAWFWARFSGHLARTMPW
jgi:hypothetical protein